MQSLSGWEQMTQIMAGETAHLTSEVGYRASLKKRMLMGSRGRGGAKSSTRLSAEATGAAVVHMTAMKRGAEPGSTGSTMPDDSLAKACELSPQTLRQEAFGESSSAW